MKRVLTIVMCAVMLVSVMAVFAGCDDDTPPTQPNTTTTTTTAQSTTTAKNDETTTGQTTMQSGGTEQSTTTPHGDSATTAPATKLTTGSTTKATTKATTKPSTVASTTTITKHLIDYSVADWFVDKDDVHILIHRHHDGSKYVPGRYFVVDTNTGKITKDFSLSENPSKMLDKDGEIWISYKDLQSVYVYDRDTFAVKRVIYLGQKVTDFAVCGDYLFYARYGGNFTNVTRYNMVTKEVAYIEPYVRYSEDDIRWGKFCDPQMLVDEKSGLIYIGDEGFADAGVFCFDMESLELVSYYWREREITNDGNSKMYLYDGKLYWAAYEFDATDLSRILRSFQTFNASRTLYYVNEDYVLTYSAIYNRHTNVMIKTMPYALAQFGIWAITESGNAVECERNMVVGRRLIFTAGKYSK